MSAIRGIDILRDSQTSIYNLSMPVIGPIGTATGIADVFKGITVKSQAMGIEFQNDISLGRFDSIAFR